MTLLFGRRFPLALAWLALGYLIVPGRSQAQPLLDFKQIGLNWPYVELTFNVRCQNILQFNFDKRNFTLRENGVDINNFSIQCGDSTRRASTSVALVLDRSQSMSGGHPSTFDQMKNAARLFIRALDPARDEAAIISYSTSVTLHQSLTSDTAALIQALEGFKPSGGTAIWDAAIFALNELITRGKGLYKAMVLLTDGQDNASTYLSTDVIALAKSNNVIIYTVGIGVFDPPLNAVALGTGGKFFSVGNAADLAALYSDISRLILNGSLDCKIVYTGTCIDGGTRTVDLSVRDICGGGDTKSLSFTAPTNSGRHTLIHLRAGTVAQRANAIVAVPIELLDSLYFDLFYPADFTLEYDKSCLDFVSVRAPAGSLLENVAFTWQETPAGVNFRSTGKKIVSGRGLLAEALFRTHDPDDTTFCPLRFTFSSFDEGCMIPLRNDGGVKTIPCRLRTSITALSTPGFCEGDTIELAAEPGFASYSWYRNGLPLPANGERLRISLEGDYTVRVTNAIGCSGTSALLHCFYLEKRNVGIGNDSLLVFGPGEEILLPLIASPPLDNSRPYDLQFLLRYNDSRLAFAGITPFGQRQWWNLLETRIVTGGVWIHAAGPVTDSVRELFLVHFDQRGTGKESERFLFPVGSLSVTAPCIGRTSTVDPAVLIDGQCSRIAVAKSPHTTLTASPNPFNPTTDLRIRLVRAQNVTLDIFSLLGNRVARLYQGILPEGESTIRFTPTELSSGLYVARIRTDTDSRSCLLQYLK